MEQEVVQAATDPSFLTSLAIFMEEGGLFMWIIFAVWCVGAAISVERLKALFSYDIDGEGLMNLIKKNVLGNDVHKAIQSCSNSKALLPQVLKSGLKRANQSKEQIADAVEATVLEVAPKVEKRMGYLGLVANVSTLLGLLGTIQGLIQSFAAVATADPASKAKLLALGISKAMNTTAIGLVSAISIMVIHAMLTNKSEKILEEIDEYSAKLVDLLGTKRPAQTTTARDDQEAA
jgi:biopolymer transport protein ExbB/TolQ